MSKLSEPDMERNAPQSARPRTAVVTGASSGIGLAVSIRLGQMGYEVYGFGRDFGRLTEEERKELGSLFHPEACDLLDTQDVLNRLHEAERASDHGISVLVNNAGAAYYGLHEELNPEKIQAMVRTNLELPMILTQQLLRTLKANSGTIVNVTSVTAVSSNPHGCAYGATKAGLESFGRSLFDEARRYGVRVASVLPDMTRTALYRNADFREAEEPGTFLCPGDVADAVEFILTRRPGVVVTELKIQPQFHRIRKKPVR